ncbi:MAG: hypothetical protein DA328_05765 [Nitrososphaeraceae archaeon]|nr:hypothetical protein [Nitrososphaeraceae archaeon]
MKKLLFLMFLSTSILISGWTTLTSYGEVDNAKNFVKEGIDNATNVAKEGTDNAKNFVKEGIDNATNVAKEGTANNKSALDKVLDVGTKIVNGSADVLGNVSDEIKEVIK